MVLPHRWITGTLTPAWLGAHGPGETTIARRPELTDLVDVDRVVAAHDQVRPQLAQVLDEVVGERVVVVDDEEHDSIAC